MLTYVLKGTGADFPRLVPDANSDSKSVSVAGGPRFPCVHTPDGVGAHRRRPVTLLKAMAAVALWDARLDTAEIAHALEVHEADVQRCLDIVRDERRARS